MGIGERITIGRKQKGLSQQQLADQVGVTRASCSQWERNVSAPSVNHLAEVARLLELQFEWLATGRGQKDFVVTSGKVSEPPPATPYNTRNDELSELFQLLPHALQDAVFALVKAQIEMVRPSKPSTGNTSPISRR